MIDNELAGRMQAGNAGCKVINIPQDRIPEAGAVLARAFEHDPAIRYIFGISVTVGAVRLQDFYHLSCQLQIKMSWPLFGVEKCDRIVSVASLTLPGTSDSSNAALLRYRQVEHLIGPEAGARFKAFFKIIDSHRPGEPHIFLGLLGVDPGVQGKGYGRMLLEYTHRLSEEHSTSIGVALDTENPVNVPMYEHFGYRTAAIRRLNDLRIWCMFRPNGKYE